jgi:predicted enzyme related to lactoylglutathione lyase
MPARETAPNGAPCWVDLMTSDVERSKAFYTQVFGWTAEEANEDFGGYFNFTRDGVRVAGCTPHQPEMGAEAGVPDVWSIYLATDDAAKTVEAATANGGEVQVPAMQLEDLGTMAVVGDPTGASIGIWQPGSHKGFGVITEDGAPSWFELHTRDYDAAVSFYRDAFSWDTQVASDTPELRYTLLVDGEEQLAGIVDVSDWAPEGVPAQWKVYFGADDADATLAKVVELGGTITQPAEDTPYGRLATATDPMGAEFKLISQKLKNPTA